LKFTPKLNLVKTRSKGEKNIEKPMSVKRLLLPIPAKSLKKVNEISKFFKTNNTRKVLKIKETFLNL